jgi:hypothetical protein
MNLLHEPVQEPLVAEVFLEPSVTCLSHRVSAGTRHVNNSLKQFRVVSGVNSPSCHPVNDNISPRVAPSEDRLSLAHGLKVDEPEALAPRGKAEATTCPQITVAYMLIDASEELYISANLSSQSFQTRPIISVSDYH